jgi:hypothetical protein
MTRNTRWTISRCRLLLLLRLVSGLNANILIFRTRAVRGQVRVERSEFSLAEVEVSPDVPAALSRLDCVSSAARAFYGGGFWLGCRAELRLAFGNRLICHTRVQNPPSPRILAGYVWARCLIEKQPCHRHRTILPGSVIVEQSGPRIASTLSIFQPESP